MFQMVLMVFMGELKIPQGDIAPSFGDDDDTDTTMAKIKTSQNSSSKCS